MQEHAVEEREKYKEGKSIVEKAKVMKVCMLVGSMAGVMHSSICIPLWRQPRCYPAKTQHATLLTFDASMVTTGGNMVTSSRRIMVKAGRSTLRLCFCQSAAPQHQALYSDSLYA